MSTLYYSSSIKPITCTVQRDFTSESEAYEWIILNQFSRRNIDNYITPKLALLLEPIISEKAKKNQGNRVDLTSRLRRTKGATNKTTSIVD